MHIILLLLLKELIQNADDAQAEYVGFLIDWRQHPTDDVMFPNFKPYQGPALYAWNSAVFKSNDWRSLGKIGQSSKEVDVLKVGRLGLGFQTVFHITGMHVCAVISRGLCILSTMLMLIEYKQRNLNFARFSGKGCYVRHYEKS